MLQNMQEKQAIQILFLVYPMPYFLSNDAETSWTDTFWLHTRKVSRPRLLQSARQRKLNWFYTLDGSIPTAKSTSFVESGKEISINGTCTLKVGLLVNGEVKISYSSIYD